MTRLATRQASRKRASIGLLAAMLLMLLMAAAGGSARAASEPGHGDAAGHGDPTEHFNWTNLDYKDRDVAGGTLEKGEEGMPPPMILMFVNFAIVLALVGWKVAPPVRRYVFKRHETIKEALEEAAKLREQAKAKLDEYTAQVSKAEAEVEKLIADIRSDAEAEKQRIIQEAEDMAAIMKRDAENRIAAAITAARREIQLEVVAAAVAAAERLIRENAGKDDQTKLIDSFISDMQKQASAPAKERA